MTAEVDTHKKKGKLRAVEDLEQSEYEREMRKWTALNMALSYAALFISAISILLSLTMLMR